VLADTSFALIEDILRKPIPLKDYLDRRYVSQIQSSDHTPQMSQDRRDDLNLILARNYGSVGDFRVAQRIAALDPLARNIHVSYALEYTAALLKQDNVILIGSRKSNPWVDLFASGLNFTIEYDPDRQVSLCETTLRVPVSRRPTPHHHHRIRPAGYSVVSYLPNPGQVGKVLIIAGTGSEATEGAGEFNHVGGAALKLQEAAAGRQAAVLRGAAEDHAPERHAAQLDGCCLSHLPGGSLTISLLPCPYPAPDGRLCP